MRTAKFYRGEFVAYKCPIIYKKNGSYTKRSGCGRIQKIYLDDTPPSYDIVTCGTIGVHVSETSIQGVNRIQQAWERFIKTKRDQP